MTSLVDMNILRELQALGGDDPEFVLNIIQIFLQEAPLEIETIRRHQQNGDAKQMGQAAHRLKSSTQNLGIHEMTELCTYLDQLGLKETLGNSKTLIDQLSARFVEAQKTLQEILKTRSIPS